MVTSPNLMNWIVRLINYSFLRIPPFFFVVSWFLLFDLILLLWFSPLGWSVSLSADASRLAVGGIFDDDNVGGTWVFKYDGSTYTQIGKKLVGTGYVGPYDAQQGKCIYEV